MRIFVQARVTYHMLQDLLISKANGWTMTPDPRALLSETLLKLVRNATPLAAALKVYPLFVLKFNFDVWTFI